jgi:hypothetical protein
LVVGVGIAIFGTHLFLPDAPIAVETCPTTEVVYVKIGSGSQVLI